MLSDHFNLTHTPFTDDNDLTGLFSCPEFEDAYDELLLGVLDGRRLQLVVGPTGSGRSTILARVNTGLQPTEFDIISIAYAGLTLDEFLSRLSAEVAALTPHINPPWPEDELVGDEGNATDRLQHALGERQNSGRPIVILIDDAQHLGAPLLNPLPELLCDSDNEALAQVVMAVSPEFVQRLTGIELDQLNASIDGILHLSPWDSTTVTDYVCACVQACAGVAGQIFTEEALAQIYQESGGVPARINKICIAAMTLAREQGKRRVDPTHVLAAGREIGGLDADDEDAWDNALELSELPAFSVDEGLADSGRRRADKLPLMTRIVAGIMSAPTAVLGALSAASRKLPFSPIRGPSRTVLAGASVLVVALVAGFMFLLNPLGSPANSYANSPSSTLVKSSPNSRPASGVPHSARILSGAKAGESWSARTQQPDAQIEQLTSAVESMRRTLVSIEARMRGFETDAGRLKQTVQTLERAPRALQASTVTPAHESAPSTDSAKVVMASTRAPQALPAARTAPKTHAAAPAKVLATTPPKALARVQRPRVETMAATQKKSTIVVRKGDTLWELAKTHNTTVAGIAKLNGLRPSATLRQGQRLTIATKANADNRWYVVRKGDSLYSIAKRFAVVPANLVTWNCLEKRQQIFPGQRLSVARSSPARCEAGRG
ncbi:MAG: type II secretory pathway predicted ATPase ExeA/LysM repeat protein [Gammaproteobacteria bacterium]|jgi:type II secretory pathway predicted ATPase ExeA/LysM repeat protein